MSRVASVTAQAGIATIEDGLRALGLSVPSGAEAQLDAYLTLLEKWNGVYNLTAIRERPRMVTHHVLDSLAVLPALASLGLDAPVAEVLDVGSGAGVPGIPFAIARPHWRLVLCEPSHKKAAFLAQAAAELQLPNVEVAPVRVESLERGRRFPLIVSRAFSDLATFVRSAEPHLSEAGAMIAMKGVMPSEEIAELPPGVDIAAVPALAVPGLDAARHLVVMKRKDPA